MDRVRFLEHNGRKILFLDFARCQPEDVFQVMDECKRFVTSQPEHSVLTLSDVTDGQFTKDSIQRMKEVAAYDRPYVTRAAWIGVDTIPSVVLESIKQFSLRDFRPFPSREAALDWLTSGDE